MKNMKRIIVNLLLFSLTAVSLLSGCQRNASEKVFSIEVKDASSAGSLNKEQSASVNAQAELEKEKQLALERKAEEEKKLEAQRKAEEQKKIEEQKKLEPQKPEVTQAAIMEQIINSPGTLEEKMRKYLGSNLSMVGLVYYDLNSGEKIAINENKVFLAASTVKVQMNMIAYDLVRQGKLSLEEKLTYSSSFYEGGTGILQGMDKSNPIPIKTLLDYSIIYSDNIATNMMLRRLGGSKNVRKITNSMVGTKVDTTKNNVTTEEEFRVLKKLYDGRNDKYYSHLIDVMKKTTFHDRLDKYVPKEICAHKIGDYGGYVNDVGIIFTEKPYILVVYTNGLAGSAEKIAQLSKLVYREQLEK